MSRLSVIKPRFVHHDSTLITVILIAHFADACLPVQSLWPLFTSASSARAKRVSQLTVVSYLITERLNEPSRLHSWWSPPMPSGKNAVRS